MPRTHMAAALAALTASSLSALAWAGKPRGGVDSRDTSAAPRTEPRTVIDGYQRWSRINPKPFLVLGPAAADCAAALPSRSDPSPHLDRFITVYASPSARQPMGTQARPRFPAGSVLVKEKRVRPEDRMPELLTVMEKKPAGFDPKHGDWEYSVWDGAGKRIDGGKVAHCQACHEKASSTGYVFRDYLPTASRRTLR